MYPHRVEEASNRIVEDLNPILLVDVFVAQEFDEVARIHAIQAIEKQVKATLKVNELAVLNILWRICPCCQMDEDLKHIGKEGADRCRYDWQ